MSTRGAGALSGALASLALPPFNLWPLAFGALVPLTLSLTRPRLDYREVVAGGLWFGALFYGVTLHWVPFTVHGLMPLGALIGSLTIVILAAVGGVQAVALHHLVVRRGRAPVLAIPAVWVTTEVILGYAGPLAIPWTPLGLSLAAAPTLAGPAEWVGVRGLTLWIALVNGGMVQALVSRARRATALNAVAATLLALGPAVAGLVRDRGLPMSQLPPVLVGQIQIPREEMLDPDRRDQRAAEALTRLMDSVGTANAGPLVAVLPEAPFSAAWTAGVEDRTRIFARQLSLPILVGAHTLGAHVPDEGEARQRRNSVMLVDSDGTTQTVHSKTRIVPGVERPGLVAGPRGGILSIEALHLGFAICFEAAFGRDVRRLRNEGANLLVNPTNDAWLRPALPVVGSAALAQHRAHLILRAVETRMGAVRSSLGGELLAIDPDGRVLAIRPAGGEGIVTVRPSASPLATGYVRYGDVGGLAGLSLLAVLLCGRPRKVEPSG